VVSGGGLERSFGFCFFLSPQRFFSLSTQPVSLFFFLVNENFFCPFPGFFVFFAHCLRRLWPRGWLLFLSNFFSFVFKERFRGYFCLRETSLMNF